jgi:hypothetical protein
MHADLPTTIARAILATFLYGLLVFLVIFLPHPDWQNSYRSPWEYWPAQAALHSEKRMIDPIAKNDDFANGLYLRYLGFV